MFWILHSVDDLSLFCFVPFQELWLFISFGTCFFLFLFWSPPCFGFYVLDRAVISPVLIRVGLYSVSYGAQWFSVPGHLSHVLQVCPFCVLYVPSYCSWASVGLCTSIGGIDSQANWLWGLKQNNVRLIEKRSGTQNRPWSSPLPTLHFFQRHLLMVSHLSEVSTAPCSLSLLTNEPTVFFFFFFLSLVKQVELLLNAVPAFMLSTA